MCLLSWLWWCFQGHIHINVQGTKWYALTGSIYCILIMLHSSVKNTVLAVKKILCVYIATCCLQPAQHLPSTARGATSSKEQQPLEILLSHHGTENIHSLLTLWNLLHFSPHDPQPQGLRPVLDMVPAGHYVFSTQTAIFALFIFLFLFCFHYIVYRFVEV